MIMMKHRVLFALIAAVLLPHEAAAQLDPLLFLKDRKPNVVVMVETNARMLRDANGDYRDPNIYRRLNTGYELALGVADANTTSLYRRKYVTLTHVTGGDDKFTADHIEIVGDRDATYTNFDEYTKIAFAKRSLIEAINRNTAVVRFGLMRTRQNNPRMLTPASADATLWNVNSGPVRIVGSGLQALAQKLTGDDSVNKWNITRGVVDGNNGAVGGPVAPLVAADAANAHTSILNILGLSTGAASSLIPAGNDDGNTEDWPLDLMLTDLKAEAARLITADTQCRNTVVLIVAGARGDSTSGDTSALATQFVTAAASHRSPIYVIALAPSAGEVASLQAIATNSGGGYLAIPASTLNASVAGQPVPEIVRGINRAVQHAFKSQAECDAGTTTEHQVTSPIVGSVNLENALDITGVALPNTIITHPITGITIPQRSNVLVTSGFTLPGFDMSLRAFRTYKPVVDATKSTGYKFSSDGTRLWTACAPGTVGTGPCSSLTTDQRNIYTVLPDGTSVALTVANALTLQSHLYPAAVHPSATLSDAQTLINFVRTQPLGAILGSTPAIMDPPSLDPPPDADYPAFSDANKNRRSIVWVGANDGMLHAIDGRLGVEVWAYVPYNLLSKLYTLRSGQPVGDFRYFVDGSPKVADVKVGGVWRTYLIIGQGSGGRFYHTFDVTLPLMSNVVAPTSDSATQVLAYFAVPTNVPLKWTFPRMTQFDPSCGVTGGACAASPWGDLYVTASDVEKTVGETWSDPAVGQITSGTGPFSVLTGSGFLPYSVQQQTNRAGAVAGTTFYVLNIETGEAYASRDVGSDGNAETIDNCAATATNDCGALKNALQADPVATGPPDSRYVSKVYIGDLDGKLWRLDISLNATGTPQIPAAATLMHSAGAGHPMFSSMATVNVGNTNQYLFQGTGSDLLPSNGVSQQYKLLVVLDNGGSGSKTAEIALTLTDSSGSDEKVTSFPAVAGDIVFFATTSFKPATPCTAPDANLYAFTFIGGPAYDTSGDGKVSNSDSTRIRQTAGARASAPFIVDQHLVFGTGGKIEMFGDQNDYNNGVGQAGVRILSWREVR
jgi:hypothetical protein